MDGKKRSIMTKVFEHDLAQSMEQALLGGNVIRIQPRSYGES